MFLLPLVSSQGDVELPEVPDDELPEVPEATEKKPGECVVLIKTVQTYTNFSTAATDRHG